MSENVSTTAIPPAHGAGMRSLYRSRPSSVRHSFARICSLVLMAGGLAVIVGWWLDIQVLKSLSPSWASMKVNTALCFLLCGLAYWLLSDPTNAVRRLGALLAIAVTFTLGVVTLLEYLLGTDLGIDQLLMQQQPGPAGRAPPGRMSAATAVCFVLLVTALLSLSAGRRRGRSVALATAWLLAALSIVAVVGYTYGVSRFLYPVWPFSSMALHTAVLFGVAAAGILGAHSDRSPLAILALEGSGSSIARRMLPFAIALPLVIGWLSLKGAQAGYYGMSFGLTVLVSASILSFTVLVWVAATSLNRADVISRQANAAIASEATRRRVLFEQARDGIVIFDERRRIYEANASFAAMLGYSHEDASQLRPWEWDAEFTTAEKFFEAWPSIPVTTGQLETRFRRKGGDVIDVDISYTPAEVNGRTYLYCVCRDISARKRAEYALLESQERFKRALANIPDVVVIYDRDLRIRFINEATREVTGMRAADFIGLRDDEIFPPEVFEAYVPALKKALESKTMSEIDTDLVLPGGRARSLRITCIPLLDRAGDVREILGITHDYTSRKKAQDEALQSQAQYRDLIEQAADGIFITGIDGRFLMVNSTCCELLGYSREELLRMNGRDTYLDEEVDASTMRMHQLSSGHNLRYERMLKRKDGQAFPAEISIKMLDADRIQVIFHDITTRRQQEQKIARLSRIHAVLSGINSAIVRVHDRADLFGEACRIAVEAGKFKIAWLGEFDSANNRVTLLAQTGFPAEMALKEGERGPVIDLVPDGPARFAIQEKRPIYDNDIAGSLHLSKMRRIAIRQGAKSVIALPLTVESSLFGLLVLYGPERNFFDEEELKLLKGLAADISFALEFIAKREKVDYLAFYDPLTDLPNRRLFFDSFKQQLGRAERAGQHVVLQIVDVDRFRMINETYGRDGADRLISMIAERMSNALDDDDLVSRVGPDWFAVSMAVEPQTAITAHVLEDFYASVFGAAFDVGAEELRVSAKAGVAIFPDDGRDGQALMTNAEAAHHTAKASNVRFAFYSPTMNERVADSIRLESRLRRALEQDEMLMWYQPKTEVRTGDVTGFEALMRWQDKETGKMVHPGKFIPIMEQTGMILDAGRRALGKVIQDCEHWTASGMAVPRIAVNVSLMQLREEDFVSSIIGAHEQAERCGCALDLELTESVLMENVESIVARLQTLSGLGVQIAVDDFGTGYSSLAYIARLPIHALKIDRSFVFGMMQDQNSLTIVKSTISLAHSLGLRVIAEGVETAEQVDLLGTLDCDEIQGYYISPPVPPDDVSALLQRLR